MLAAYNAYCYNSILVLTDTAIRSHYSFYDLVVELLLRTMPHFSPSKSDLRKPNTKQVNIIAAERLSLTYIVLPIWQAKQEQYDANITR